MTSANRPDVDPWMTTYLGRKFNPTTCTEEDIYIEDIAHALSNLCRYSGHCGPFYSVGEHCLRVCDLLPPSMKLAGLLHDSPEAYTGTSDVPSLIKHNLFPQICELEERLLGIIFSRFKVKGVDWKVLKRVENVITATEVRDLKRVDHDGWYLPEPPLKEEIIPWSSPMVEAEYLKKFKELTQWTLPI